MRELTQNVSLAWGLARAALRGRQSLVSYINQMVSPRYGDPPRRGTVEYLQMYRTSPRLRPVYKKAKAVAATGYGLYPKGSDKKLDNHPLLDLLAKPNSHLTTHDIFYLTSVYLDIIGDCGWIIERNGLKLPAELYPVPGMWIQDLPTVERPFYRVLNLVNGRQFYVDEQDMVFFKEPDPNDPYGRGLGSAHPIADEVETDEYMTKYSKRFFFNDAKPPFIIQAPGATDTEIRRIEQILQEKVGGVYNSYKPLVAGWDIKLQELGRSQKELDFSQSRKDIRDFANQHWFMPPELMGIIENSNRATIDAAYYLFAKEVVKPRLDGIKDVIDIRLVPQFGGNEEFRFDDIVPEDRDFALRQANDGLNNGAIMVDEWREKNGWEPLPDGRGRVFYIPLKQVAADPMEIAEVMDEPIYLPPDDEPPPKPDDKPGEEKPDDKPDDKQDEEEGINLEDEPPKKVARGVKLDPELRKVIWRNFDKAMIAPEISCRRGVVKYFQSQQSEALKKFDEIFRDKAMLKSSSDDIVELLLSWTDERERLQRLMQRYWLEAAESGWRTVEGTFNFGVKFDLIRTEMMKWIETTGAYKVRKVTETTKASIRNTLAQGIEAGESIPKLRDRVSAVFTEAKVSRATMIARTETHNTVLAGSFETYKQAQVHQKEWLATQDDRTRDSHAMMDGERVGIDQEFSNGLMYPGDGNGEADEVINCRCALLPVIEGGE